MDRWQKLLSLAKDKTEAAGQILAVTRQQISALESQSTQMQSYRDDYAGRASAVGQRASIRDINALREFGNKVQMTVMEIEGQLDAQRSRYKQQSRHWRAAYSREKALEALIEIEAKRQQLQEQREQQRMDDDFAQQLLVRRKQT